MEHTSDKRLTFDVRIMVLAVILAVCAWSADAQKLVKGSDVPAFKSIKGIEWVNGTPDDLKDIVIIDFFQPANPSCVEHIERLREIVGQYDVVSVVIMTKDHGDEIETLGAELEGIACVGIDRADNGFFEKCNIKFLPHTMIVGKKNKLLWHGILNTLSESDFRIIVDEN